MPLRARASTQPGKAAVLFSPKVTAVLRPRALTSSSRTAVEDQLSCPVCCEIFSDPVVLRCSHSFCRACLHQFWSKKGPKRDCPVCRRRCSLTEPTVSLVLKNVCETLLQEQKGTGPCGQGSAASRPLDLCSAHGEPLKLFCQDDEELLCCVCHTSQKHQGHRMCPMEEAAHDLKAELEKEIVPMKKNLRRLYEVKQEHDDMTVHIKEQRVQAEKQIREEFAEIRQFLGKEEAARIALLAEEDEEKRQLMKKKTDNITRDILTFTHAVKAIDDEVANSDSLFLRHYKVIKKRTHLKFNEPEKVPAALINVAKHVSSLKFSVWEKMQAMIEYTPVTLDPNTAYPCLSLSRTLTSVSNSGVIQKLPDNPERFDHFVFVLGSEGFSSGCHAWEVEVGGNNDWVIGVARESIARKGKVSGGTERGFWTVALSDGRYVAMTVPPTQLSVTSRLQRVRVRLDYEAGEVSFSNPLDMTPIYTFTACFSERIFPFFCPGANINGSNPGPLKICSVKVALWNSASW
ncbi:tripartite motif-containing protein 35 isoform X1 [Electrophorus electricus]|uniref:Tripartite motif containing 35-12 n=1 Tax=Electrophorus electricus TaxID=8005 RepID=A0A4W4FUT3_ELEEL|nr:tripartite motif-containing protein 35 isoform X1 [Electrophorus electricus]